MVRFVQGNALIHDLYRLTSEILVVHTMCASAGPKATDLHALRVAQSIPTAACLSSFLSHPYAAQNKRFRFTFLCKHIEKIMLFLTIASTTPHKSILSADNARLLFLIES